MQQLDLVIHNATGLHARPARVFVDIAKKYQSSVHIRHGEKRVNAKSLIAVLTLGVTRGQHIQVDVSGADEETAAAALAAAVWDGLGEGASADESPAPLVSGHPAGQPEAPIYPGAVVRGVAGAPGIAVGPVYRLERAGVEVRERFTGASQELTRLQVALDAAREQIAALREQIAERASAGNAEIFDVHSDILADPDLLDGVRAAIADGRPAAAAWQEAIAAQAAAMAAVRDRHLAERAADICDVGDRVLRLLVGADQVAPDLPDDLVIVLAHDLTPSQTAALDPQRVLGFCTAVGGPNAHTAILARALGLPAVVSAGAGILDLAPGTLVILDGTTGTLTVAPDAGAVAAAQAAAQQERDRAAAAACAAGQPALTTDGHRVEVAANIGGLDDALKAVSAGAEGVGLLRTEFLFLDRTAAPSEDEQFAVYRSIARALGRQPVTVRTLDIGGDKPLPYLDLPHEDNPFLGERGIRLCLARPDLLREQIRAILRAAGFGRLRIMFPMIADAAELRAARAIVGQVRAELHAPLVEIGIMVEIPAAALMADVLAQEADFFSIGTNDLTQYTLAMDRTHPALAARADGLHPAVLRLIARTVDAAHLAGKWVGVCGELAADPAAVPILVGLGVDELSVSVPAIPGIKAQIRSLTRTACVERARQALECATAAEVREGARKQ